MKQYFRDRKELNYAYNINNSPNSTRTKKINFNSLSKNFYEDIINSDIRIKNNRHILSRIKSKSIKESIYSNKIIPGSWKIMLDYQPTVYKAIDKDPSFAYYLGRSQNQNNDNKFHHAQQLKSVNDMQSVGQKSMSSFIKKFFVEKSEKKDNSDILQEKSNKDGDNFSITESRKELEKVENKIMKRTLLFQGRDKMHFNDKNIVIDDKLISSKLDEYRTKYDLNKYMRDIKNKKEEDDKNKKKALNILSFQEAEERENNYKQFLKTRTKSDKERVLKSSIYYNLISTHKTDMKKSESKAKKIKLKPIETGNIFLFHNEEFDKVIEITNPKIKRDLELINYYGPLYTHSKFCNNRNLEFYKNSEPNQTLKLLQYLKKIKLGDTEDKEDKKN